MSEINQTDLNLNTDFTNRESQFPNRRIIKIISQTPNEIIADIERDEGNVSNNGTKINAEQFQNIETKLNNLQTQVTNKQGTIVKINEVSQENINFESDPQTQINNILNNLSKIKNSYGGFAAGQNANSTYGVAVGNGASSTSGVSIGGNASASNGVAVGVSAKTGDGFAGGYQAKTVNENGVVIDAIQLGTGTNTQEKTLQVYNDNIYNANTKTMTATNGNFNNINESLSNLQNNINSVFNSALKNLTSLWAGSTGSGQLELSENISDFKLIVLQGIQGSSYPYIVSTVVYINNVNDTYDAFLGANGSTNSYNIYVRLNGKNVSILDRKNALIQRIYGIK